MRPIMKWLTPRTAVTFSMTYVFRPEMAAPTTTTEATPMMMPIRVRNALSLCAKMDWSAIRAASA